MPRILSGFSQFGGDIGNEMDTSERYVKMRERAKEMELNNTFIFYLDFPSLDEILERMIVKVWNGEEWIKA